MAAGKGKLQIQNGRRSWTTTPLVPVLGVACAVAVVCSSWAISQDASEVSKSPGQRADNRTELSIAAEGVDLSANSGGEMAQEATIRDILAQLAPRSASQSLECFEVRPGFRVELVCAEPMVADPIAIDWGPDGRLWVVEMGDYPTGGQRSRLAAGRVRYLLDRDHDGTFDESRVFLDGLHYPTGVLPWRDGILVACAPDIFFARDTDGDGRADQKEVLYSGFVQENPQHQVNSLRFGLDNWVYVANGDNGGVITSRTMGQWVDIHGRDCRLRPDQGLIETATGMSQYGRCRDAWGNWFGGRNLKPIWHCVLPDHYLRRNPLFAPPDPCVDLMNPPACAPVFPISPSLPRFNELWTFNRFTSACGIEIYRDDLFGDAFSSSCFICEPTYNLVFHGNLHREGVTFSCRRPPIEQQKEFLASRDSWFRPTQVRTGPDGALWIVDMYRLVIEHPDYIPEELHEELDFRAGTGRGRIYRVVPESRPTRTTRPIDQLHANELVTILESPNGPLRDLARLSLIWRGDRAAEELLQKLAVTGRRPESRMAALATLDGLGILNSETLLVALEDLHPSVRRMALRLSEQAVTNSESLQRSVLRRIDDSDPQVRLQAAFSLGEWSDPRAGEALAEIALRNADDHFIIAAVMSSAGQHPGEILQRLVANRSPSAAQVELIANLFQLVMKSQSEDDLAFGLRYVSPHDSAEAETWQFQVMAELLNELTYRGSSWKRLHDGAGAELKSAMEHTQPLFEAARRVVTDEQQSVERRVAAVRILGRGLRQRDVMPLLLELLSPQSALELQQAAVAAMGRIAPIDLPAQLLEDWEQHGPELRRSILATLLNRPEWTLQLVEAMEQGRVLPREIGATERNSLVLHNSADVRRRVSELFRTTTEKEIPQVVQHYRDRLKPTGNLQRGKQVFTEHCSACHQIGGEGNEVGADILTLSDRSQEALLVAILDPNRSVAPRYTEYTVITVDGRVLSGIIASESGNSITLLDTQGEKHVLLRRNLDELNSTGNSLMPIGMEKLFTQPNDLNDLIAYLRSLFEEPPRSE
jgi:putative membrane-bound dehydrogenase-like protein